MIPLTYTYLTLSILFFCAWLLLFISFPKIRREMFFISIGSGLVGLIFQTAYLTDWWNTPTFTGTRFGLEDYLFNFSICGIGAVLYEIVLKKVTPQLSLNQLKEKILQPGSIFVLLAPVITFLILFYFASVNSLLATVGGFSVPILFIWLKNSNLITRSLVSAVFLLCAVFVIYNIVSVISPEFNTLWFFEFNGQKISYFNVPLEDIIGFAFVGMYVGPLYTYVTSNKK